MRHTRTHRLVLCALPLWLLPALAEAAHVNVIELDNRIINPVTQQYIEEAIERSEQDASACLILKLDTPGGLLDSTRAIVKRIMNARVPVVVYVAPSGSRAGSAGVFITLSAHVAAMAPSTNIGAAHPVGVGGEGGPLKKLIKRLRQPADGRRETEEPVEEELIEEETRDPMGDKILNDTVAWITTIAAARGRNEVWAKQAVTESVSVTDVEAVHQRIVDLVAPDLPQLLRQIDGRRVTIGGIEVELATADAVIVELPMTRRQQFLAVITNPNIAYLLMMLGTFGLIFEFTHPGIGFPGIAGLICLLLALYAFQSLPVSYVALALIGLGLALFIAELQVVSGGLLGFGAVVALTLGSLMLFESPDPALRVSLRVVVPTVGTLAAIALLLVQQALRAQAQPTTTGAEGLRGQVGEARTPLDPAGTVFVQGALWSARSARPVPRGGPVRVLRVEGITLVVEPMEQPGGS